MREVFMRWRYVVACAVVLAVVVNADARDAALVRTADADAGARSVVTAAQREARERKLPRIIRRIIKSLTDELIGPHP